MKKIIFFLCALIGFAHSSHPISETAVTVGAVGTGIGVGLLSYKATGDSLFIGGFAGVATGFLAYLILNQFTPAGRVARARTKLDCLAKCYFSSHEFENDEAFFSALQEVYVLSDLPLMVAYNDFAYLIGEGYEALSLIDAAKAEAGYDIAIIQQCDLLVPRINHALALMTQAVKRIRSSTEYLKQVKIYKEMQAAREKLAVQQQIAHAQTQIAHAQMHQAYNDR